MAALLKVSNHVIRKLKGYEVRDGREHKKSGSSLKVSRVGTLAISIGSSFHELGNLTEKAAFLRSR